MELPAGAYRVGRQLFKIARIDESTTPSWRFMGTIMLEKEGIPLKVWLGPSGFILGRFDKQSRCYSG